MLIIVTLNPALDKFYQDNIDEINDKLEIVEGESLK